MLLKEAKTPGGPGVKTRCRQTKQIPTKEVSEHAKLFRPVAQSLIIPKRVAKKHAGSAEPLEPTPRVFSSYLLGPEVHSHPSHPVASHTDAERIQQPVSTNPCLVQSLRWDPYVKTTTIPENQENNAPSSERVELRDNSDTRNSSRHENNNLHSPSRSSRLFKNNIMTFCDQQTMTMKRQNACVGITPRSSQVSIESSSNAVRDTCDNVPLLSFPIPPAYSTKEYRVRRYPSSILKKPSHHRHCTYDDFVNQNSVEFEDEKDVYEVPYCRGSAFESRPHRKQCYMGRPRKVLYNEGIDDLVTESERYTPLRAASPASVKRDPSRVTLVTNCYNETGSYIPFSHRSESKYHTSCMEPSVSPRQEYDAGRRLGGGRKSQMYVNPQLCRKAATPKRLLASDQDIDTYIETHTRPLVMPRRIYL